MVSKRALIEILHGMSQAPSEHRHVGTTVLSWTGSYIWRLGLGHASMSLVTLSS